MWKRSFRARLPSKSESWRCENEAFVRDSPQNLEVEDVKTTLSCKTSFKFESSSGENEAFVRDFPQNVKVEDAKNEAFVRDFPQKVKVEDVKTTLSCKTSFRFWKFKWWKWSLNCQFHCGGWSENDPGLNERVPKPSAGQDSPSIFWSTFCPAKHSNFVHPPTLKNRFRARLPSTSES